jgi:energy-coupling factor transporter ATP-binding protein EcfA2
MENEYVLSMEGISKQFPGVRALSNVKLHARKGSVHALMGENGAGKSTLMKCLIGIYAPDSGTITFKGEKLNITHPLCPLQGHFDDSPGTEPNPLACAGGRSFGGRFPGTSCLATIILSLWDEIHSPRRGFH